MRVQGDGGRPVRSSVPWWTASPMTARREGWPSLWLGTGAAYIKATSRARHHDYVFEQAADGRRGGSAIAAGLERTGKIV